VWFTNDEGIPCRPGSTHRKKTQKKAQKKRNTIQKQTGPVEEVAPKEPKRSQPSQKVFPRRDLKFYRKTLAQLSSKDCQKQTKSEKPDMKDIERHNLRNVGGKEEGEGSGTNVEAEAQVGAKPAHFLAKTTSEDEKEAKLSSDNILQENTVKESSESDNQKLSSEKGPRAMLHSDLFQQPVTLFLLKMLA
jgi:hypothetical protein